MTQKPKSQPKLKQKQTWRDGGQQETEHIHSETSAKNIYKLLLYVDVSYWKKENIQKQSVHCLLKRTASIIKKNNVRIYSFLIISDKQLFYNNLYNRNIDIYLWE